MTISEMIAKYGIRLHGESQLLIQNYVPGGNKLSQDAKDQIVAAKPKILAELLRRKADAEAKEQAETDDILSGAIPIKAHYHDGEYLSGYEVYGKAAELLEKLGVTRYVDGWGYHIERKAIDTLGTEFTYQQAAEYARPALEAKQAEQVRQDAERQAKFDEARETGKPVLLKQWPAECNDPHEECSTDIVSQYAMPDGSAKKVRRHTW